MPYLMRLRQLADADVCDACIPSVAQFLRKRTTTGVVVASLQQNISNKQLVSSRGEIELKISSSEIGQERK